MTNALRLLAEAYSKSGGTLYLVGGAVRDQLLGRVPGDVDICGDLPPDAALAAFRALPDLRIAAEYLRFGTLRLYVRGFSFEYTSFRADSYRRGHRPEDVAFTGDIQEDAARRDFTIGCLYRDILSGALLDPTGYGLHDLQAGLLRAVRGAATLREDGLRILRLARFAAELRFHPVDGLLDIAAENVGLLADIAPERCREELSRILLADTKGGDPATGLRLLAQTGALSHFFPDMQPDIDALQGLPPQLALRLATLFWPDARVLPSLRRLRFPKAVVADIRKACQIATLDGDKLLLAAASHPRAADIARANLRRLGDPRAQTLEALLLRNLPPTDRGLTLSGARLAKELRLAPGREIGAIKRRLWEYLVLHPEASNAADELLEIATKAFGRTHGDDSHVP